MEAKNAPLIRFHGYSEDWQTQKLKHLCNTFIDGDWIESKDQSKSGIRLIQTGNIGIAKFLDKPNNAKWISHETFESLHCNEIFHNDILISRLPEPAGRACLLPNLHYRCITAVDCSIVRCNEKNDSSFIVQFLSSPKYFKEVTLLLAGGTRQRISRKNLEEITIKTPLLSEQTRIASLFTSLDKQISCSEAKLDKLRTIKKTLLKKMFASQGEKTPQIRFKGFDGAWEEKKLVDFVHFFNGQTYTPNDVKSSGTLVLRSSNVQNDKISLDDNVFIDSSCANVNNVKKGDIIVVVRNGSRSLIGKHAVIEKEMPDTVIGAFMTGIRSDIPYFTNALLSSHMFEKKVSENLGATINQITGYMFERMNFNIPSLPKEQACIASLFNSLDKQISLQEQKIEKLKAIKKTLLKKMFV